MCLLRGIRFGKRSTVNRCPAPKTGFTKTVYEPNFRHMCPSLAVATMVTAWCGRLFTTIAPSLDKRLTLRPAAPLLFPQLFGRDSPKSSAEEFWLLRLCETSGEGF